MVSRVGLEPTTPSLRGSCSNQLSYRPMLSTIIPQKSQFDKGRNLVHPEGFEPATFCSEDRRSIRLSYGCNSVYFTTKRSIPQPAVDNTGPLARRGGLCGETQ